MGVDLAEINRTFVASWLQVALRVFTKETLTRMSESPGVVVVDCSIVGAWGRTVGRSQ